MIATIGKNETPTTPVPAATVMLMREGSGDVEVLMTERNKAMGAFGGVLAFPGGKLMDSDSSAAMRALADGGDDLDDFAFSLRIAAIREAFEETGLVLARPAGSERYADRDTALSLDRWRDPVARGEADFGTILKDAGLRPAVDAMVPWARWITPDFVRRRFDTYFFAAMAPDGQEVAHDGGETVDHVWLRPETALADAEAGRRRVIFVTRMNLMKIDTYPNAAAALAGAAHHDLDAIQPARAETPEGTMIRIRDNAGYPVNQMPISTVLPQPPAD